MKINNAGLRVLTTSRERQEIRAVRIVDVYDWFETSIAGDILVINGVTLCRTFDQSWPNGRVTRFSRVIAPKSHYNYKSDLSIDGLTEWGII